VPKNSSHLTTEQLSAFLDQQLPTQEQSLCQAHLTTCDSCQQQLAQLQQTVFLMRALPRAPLPRSFVLPIESTIQNTAVAEQDTYPSQRARLAYNRLFLFPSYVRTTMRVASTLVAVLGLFFILSGSLTMVSSNIGKSQIASSSLISRKIHITNGSPNSDQVQPFTESKYPSPNVPQPQDLTRKITSSSNLASPQISTGTFPSAPNTSQPKLPAMPANTQAASSSPSTSQPQLLISLLNPGTPEGHLSLGLLLFITGFASFLALTRLGKQAREKARQR
jgi:hypothetical protein